MKRLLTILAIIFAAMTLIAQNNVITYSASEKLPYGKKNGVYKKAFNVTLIDHQFSNGKGTLVFKDKLASIGDYAFCGCSGLTSITIPKSVTSIGFRAFDGCSGLTSITIPESVTSIESWAFAYCSGLTSITIPKSVTSIGFGAFWGCTGLTSITIPESVTSIGDDAFRGCSGLTSITIPKSVTSIGSWGFEGCSGLTSIVWDAKDYCSSTPFIRICSQITNLTFGEDVERIPSGLCSRMNNLTSITIPESVTSIGYEAFYGCSGLTSITIPNSVTSIGNHAFWGCTGLTSITIPNSVTSIGNHAFWGCTGLTSITIPNSVTSIGDFAFAHCSGLTSITIPESVTSIGDGAFYNCPNLSIYYVGSSFYAFNDCRKKKVTREEAELIGGFDRYARRYVENVVNKWQQQGEFEKKAEWNRRVNKDTRQAKIDEAYKEAEQIYASYHLGQNKITTNLGRYDADNEVYRITLGDYGMAYLAVPYDEAKEFKANWDKRKEDMTYCIRDEKISIATLSITAFNGKTYTYRNTDAMTYDISDNLTFDPIEINLPSYGTSTPVVPKKIDSSVDINIPQSSGVNDKTFVLIFANENYKRVTSVPYAKNDGKVFQKYCQKTLGVPVKNIHFVEDATLGDMRSELSWASQVADAYSGQASFIVYYAGHGIPDESTKSSYLLPTDGDGRLLESAYSLDEFYAKFGRMPADHITIFMDACFSGSKREEGMLASARGIALKAKSGVPQGNMVVFSAAQGDETAYPNREEGHGMFTYYLLKKLQETKGDVTLQELGEYVTKNVRQQSIVLNGKSQTPTVTPATAVAGEWGNWKLK